MILVNFSTTRDYHNSTGQPGNVYNKEYEGTIGGNSLFKKYADHVNKTFQKQI